MGHKGCESLPAQAADSRKACWCGPLAALKGDNDIVPLKKGFDLSVETLDLTGRDGVIRTLDPLHPMQVRYQAALRPD